MIRIKRYQIKLKKSNPKRTEKRLGELFYI